MSSTWVVEHTQSILSPTCRLCPGLADEYGPWRARQALPQPEPYAIPQIIATETFTWPGTEYTKHIHLEADDSIPEHTGHYLGRGVTSEVHEVVYHETTFALKRRRVLRRNTYRDLKEFKKEQANMEKVKHHQHVAKIVGTFVHPRVIGILIWPAAICDMGTFFDDLDPLWTLYLQYGKHGCVERKKIEQAIGADAMKRLTALNVLHTSTADQSTFFPAYLRIERSFGCLATALAYLHNQGVKHKDLKPTNILLTSNNILLTDFGTSTDISTAAESATETWGGTPKYFAPEVAAYLPSGRAADIFSLGCIFLEMAYVHYGTPQEAFQQLRPSKDRSYQANIHLLDHWVGRVHMYPDGWFRSLVKDMLAAAPEKRPIASDVVERLLELRRQYDSVGGNVSSGALFGDCCAGRMTLAEMDRFETPI